MRISGLLYFPLWGSKHRQPRNSSKLIRGAYMKTRTILAAAALLACVFLTAPAADAKPIELSFSATTYETHPVNVNGLTPFMNIINEVTGGKVECTFFNPGTLCPGNEIVPNTASGVLDYGLSGLGQTAGRYPLWGVLDLPLLFNSAAHVGVVATKLYEEFPELQKELAEFKPVNLGGSAPFVLLTIDPVNKLEDMAGKKIGSSIGSSVPVLNALGASPIIMPATDLYMGLQRGMIDGVVFPIPAISSFKLQEVAKNMTIVPIMAGTSFGMFNKKTWEKLPEDCQKAIEPYLGMRAMISFTNCTDGFIPIETEKLKAAGVKVTVLDAAEVARWADKVDPLYEKWIADMEAKGHPQARAIYERTRALATEYTNEKIEEVKKTVEPFNKPIK